jgi:hypothetical protein
MAPEKSVTTRMCEAAQHLVNCLMQAGARQGVAQYRLEQCVSTLDQVLANATHAERLEAWEALAAYAELKCEFEEECDRCDR